MTTYAQLLELQSLATDFYIKLILVSMIGAWCLYLIFFNGRDPENEESQVLYFFKYLFLKFPAMIYLGSLPLWLPLMLSQEYSLGEFYLFFLSFYTIYSTAFFILMWLWGIEKTIRWLGFEFIIPDFKEFNREKKKQRRRKR